MKSNDKNEKAEVIDQIRKKYQNAASQFDSRYFDLLSLEERITAFIKSGISTLTFVKQEMEFYERLKKMAEEKKQKEIDRENLHKRMEAIMDENNERIKQYPDSAFDPRASFEIRHMAGAIGELLPLVQYFTRRYLHGLQGWNELDAAIAGVEKFEASGPGKMSIWLKEYVQNIIQNEGRNMEQLDREYLQSAAVALKGLQGRLIHMIDEESPHVRSERLKEDHTAPRIFASRLQGLTVEAALHKLSDWISGILHDFRLDELAEYGHARKS